MIIQNTSIEGHTDLTFTVPKGDLKKTLEIVERGG
jgi:aspartate kinase